MASGKLMVLACVAIFVIIACNLVAGSESNLKDANVNAAAINPRVRAGRYYPGGYYGGYPGYGGGYGASNANAQASAHSSSLGSGYGGYGKK